MTLERIKDIVATDEGFLSWADLYNRTPPYNIERYWHEIAKRYAKAKLEEADTDKLVNFLYWREKEIHPADAHNLVRKYFTNINLD